MPAKEVFSNVGSCVASGASGTTTSDTAWTMGTGSGSFPAASSTATPATYFYVTDPADTTHEIVKVTDASGTSWTVQRGALGTTAVAHATGATWVQVVSHGTLQGFMQAVTAAVTAVPVSNTVTETVVATYQPTAEELTAGTVWEVVAFGPITTTSTAPTLTWTLRWGGVAGTVLLTLVTGTNGTALSASMAAGSSFDVNAEVIMIDTTHVVANLNFFANKTSAPINGVASSQSSTAVSGSGPLVLTAKWSTANASNALTALAPLIRRAA